MSTVALSLPFVAATVGSRASVAALASLAGPPLARVAGAIADALPEPREVVPLPPTPEAEEIAAIDGSPATSAAASSPPPPTVTQSGLGVSRARVMAAVRAGIRPSGSGVPATDWRPAGLAVYGIGAVGVGLRDGDVLTRVGGTAASSPAAVISAVEAALRRKQPAIVGEVWRGHHRFVVSVELPRVRFHDERQREATEGASPEPSQGPGELPPANEPSAPETSET